MLTYEKGNSSFQVSEEVMREYYPNMQGTAMNEKIKITTPTSQAKNTHRLLNYYPTHINYKAIHISTLKHITHYPFCKLYNLWSSREYTSFPSEMLICNPSKNLFLNSFSCIDNSVCLASSILHDCIQKIPKTSIKNVTSFFLPHSNSTGKKSTKD